MLLFELHPVTRCRPRPSSCANCSCLAYRACEEEELFGQRRLAGIGVADDREATAAADLGDQGRSRRDSRRFWGVCLGGRRSWVHGFTDSGAALVRGKPELRSGFGSHDYSTVVEASSRTEEARRPRALTALRWLACGLVFALLFLLIASMVRSNRGSTLVHAIAAGKRPVAPDFTANVVWSNAPTWPPATRRILADGKVSLPELRGHAVVLNFWASWCVPCKHEAPLLADVARRYKGKVLFLGIDDQDLRSAARRFATKYGMNYVSVTDESQSIYDAYGVTGFPETYYLDARGRIVAHTPGESLRKDLLSGISAALGGSTLPITSSSRERAGSASPPASGSASSSSSAASGPALKPARSRDR